MPRCTQCSTPALYNVNGHPLCVSCTYMVKEMWRIDFNIIALMKNNAAAELAGQFGKPPMTPPIHLIPGNPIGANVRYQNINVQGSTIGVLNTGYIRELDNNMTVMRDAPSHEVFEKLKTFTQAVIDDQALDEEQKNAVVEYLATVSGELAAPADQRKKRVAKLSLNSIPDIITVSSGLVGLWGVVYPLLLEYLK